MVMRLKAVFNKKLGQWRICHDQWCKPGETSIVATILTSGDDDTDAELANKICERWNMVEDAMEKS